MSDQTIDESDGTEAGRPRNRRPLVIAAIAVLLVAAVVAAVLTFRAIGSSTPAEAVPATVPVEITVKHVPDTTKIGVVVTLGDGEGSEWNEAAQGALVAERRLALGGTDITLVTKNDGGTSAGAKTAVESLAKSGVAGIVVASSGKHVSGALTTAAEKHIPVVVPYASAEKDSWSTAPTAESIGVAMTTALGDAKSPLLVDLGGGAPAGLRVAHVLDGDDTADTAELAATIASRTGATDADDSTDEAADADPKAAPDSDAVVVSGSAQRQGALVAALQAADVTVPVVLTPDATSPAFGAALIDAGGSLSGSFRTVGVAADDARALSSDAEGRAMSAFLGGVRVLADDADAQNLTGDRPFSAVAGAADARSHDAVVALVRAVGKAGSTEPSDVTDALAALDLDSAAGIAGPALDFTRQQALGASATVLAASAQPLGLRPDTASNGDGGDSGSDAAQSTALVWFEDSTAR
ncbi:ABC transporter substrate-binding protein [Curtobacterium flaccumfaciens]|uniref:ABC transporter substrate-binding protein n=1 Tax=Curtobacterium flaccumfaciens TaxID=2035 RepID=UPI003CF671DB